MNNEIGSEAYHRRCWITLKAAAMTTSKWKLLAQMNEIECAAEGVKVTIPPSPKKKSEENQDDRKPDEEEFVRC